MFCLLHVLLFFAPALQDGTLLFLSTRSPGLKLPPSNLKVQVLGMSVADEPLLEAKGILSLIDSQQVFPARVQGPPCFFLPRGAGPTALLLWHITKCNNHKVQVLGKSAVDSVLELRESCRLLTSSGPVDLWLW